MILGVVQEQHAERAQLYRQWKQFEFPMLQDATDSLNLSSVPVPVLIDEYGIVRGIRPNLRSLKAFVEMDHERPDEATMASVKEPEDAAGLQVEKLLAAGNRLLHTADASRIGEAIATFKQAVHLDPDNGRALFSLGVAYRTRFDSAEAQSGDFQNASKCWSNALATNPNQYIWRRRIEQYGPLSAKPYPFYNWVDDAVAQINQRGETPVSLKVGLTHSERADGAPTSADTPASVENPDPKGQITLDEDNLILLAVATVPSFAQQGENVQVHLRLTPRSVKWNGEAGPIRIWIDESSQGKPQERLIEHLVDPSPNSKDSQSIDFNFQTAGDGDAFRISGYLLFHACDAEDICFYHRKNFAIDIPRKPNR